MFQTTNQPTIGDISSQTYICFGDVKQIPKSWDINPNPWYENDVLMTRKFLFGIFNYKPSIPKLGVPIFYMQVS